MINFRKIELPWLGEALEALRAELAYNNILWNIDRRKEQAIRTLPDTQSIPLRDFPQDSSIPYLECYNHMQKSVTTDFANAFPVAMQFLTRFAGDMQAELCRASYMKLPGGAVIYLRSDAGHYFTAREQYRLVVESPGLSFLKAGDEVVELNTGDLWWFNNKEKHDSQNHAARARFELVFELLPVARMGASS